MINVVLGLLGIGLVVFFHELGHLVAAKAVGVTVEAFSVGWGRKIFSFERGGTEYRVSWLPIGGYCKMKGEKALLKAWQDKSARVIDVEPGDFFYARPWQRIIVLAAGPLVNVIFAALVFAVIALVGYDIDTFENRVVLAADYGATETSAEAAGLRSGDRIIAINATPTSTFRDIQSAISRSPRETIRLRVERDGSEFETEITPRLDPNSGAGQIGVYPWVDPVVARVMPASPAALAGIQPQERIVAVNGRPVRNTIEVMRAVDDAGSSALFTIRNQDGDREVTVIPDSDPETATPVIGIVYSGVRVRSPRYGVIGAVVSGARQTWQTLEVTVRSIGLLFGGVNLNRALMGPVRITYLAGEIATEGFRDGLSIGLLSFFNFLGLISVTLAFMNLLPIPALDGGQIILSLSEAIVRKPLHPRLVYRYQMIGNAIIIALMFLALFNDVLFFARG